MKKFNIIFGEHLNGNFTNIQNLSYCANNSSKKIKDVKDFLTCYDDSLCYCMLRYYKINSSSFFSKNYEQYSGKTNEDEILLNKLKEDTIAVMKIKNDCDCDYIINNKTLIEKSKKELIEKLKDVTQELKDVTQKLKDVTQKLKDVTQKLKDETQKLKDETQKLKDATQKLKDATQKLEKLSKNDEWDSSKQKATKFYDIIININSILKVKEGWEIEMTEEGERKYEEFKNQNLIVIGVVGNMNKGKSFILSKLSKIPLLSGTSINTKGISVKYPQLEKKENRKYILLDSAGLETPILKNGDEAQPDNKDIKANYEKFVEKARDISITENFLQNFIISNSNILLLVVDLLSYSEQKLINKIKGEIRRGKREKKLFIIHNLKTFTKKEQIEKYINEFLFKSGTFVLQKHEDITAEDIKVEGEHFTEEEKNGLKIFHLIFAADGSEAGDIYNNYTIKFIEKQYSDVLTKKKFDVIEEIKEKFHLMSSKILKEKIEKNDFISNEEIKEKKIISLKDPEKNIVLKRCFIDELGYQIFKGNGFEPQYNYFKNKDTLDIRVEVPGSVEVPKIGKALYLGDCTHIKINGIKRRDKFPESPEGNIDNTRDFGEFNIDISFKTEDFKIKSEPKEQKIKNGILYIKYELEEDKIEESGTALVVEDEDE